jgi:hypothetical protein
MLNFFDADPGWKNSDPGSTIPGSATLSVGRNVMDRQRFDADQDTSF